MQIWRKKLRGDYKVHKNTQYRQFELVAKIIKRPFNHCHAHADSCWWAKPAPAGEGDVKVLPPRVVTVWAYTII